MLMDYLSFKLISPYFGTGSGRKYRRMQQETAARLKHYTEWSNRIFAARQDSVTVRLYVQSNRARLLRLFSDDLEYILGGSMPEGRINSLYSVDDVLVMLILTKLFHKIPGEYVVSSLSLGKMQSDTEYGMRLISTLNKYMEPYGARFVLENTKYHYSRFGSAKVEECEPSATGIQ